MNLEQSNSEINRIKGSEASNKLRLGIIGCGAITENSHIPAALKSADVEITALCDTSEFRLRYLARQYRLGAVSFKDYQGTCEHVDAVILAVPNNLHLKIGREFLSRGIHVLCEKPLAVTSEECAELCQAAKAQSAVLAVGYMTRFYPSTELTKLLLTSNFLGKIYSFDYEYGSDGGWETLSGYNLTQLKSGGGVLVVSGSHFFDRMCFLFDKIEVFSFSYDTHGGVEANCSAVLRAHIKDQIFEGQVTLSKTHKLRNRLRVIGERGTLEVGEGQDQSILFYPDGGQLRHEISFQKNDSTQEYFKAQLDDFVWAIRNGCLPRVDGLEASKSVALTERCYEVATLIDEPWEYATIELLKSAFPVN